MSKEAKVAEARFGTLSGVGRRRAERFWVPGTSYLVHTRDDEWVRGELIEMPSGEGVRLHLDDGKELQLATDSIRFVYQPDERMSDRGYRNVEFEVRMRDRHRIKGELHDLSSIAQGVCIVGHIGDLQGRFMLAPDVIESVRLKVPEQREEPAVADPVATIEPGATATHIGTPADLKKYLDAQADPAARASAQSSQIGFDVWFSQAGEEEEARLRFAQARRFDVPLIDLTSITVDEQAAATISPALARRLHVLPLALRRNTVAVAMLDPADVELNATLEFLTRRRVVPLLAMRRALDAGISRYYDRVEDTALLNSLGLRSDVEVESDERADMERLAGEQPVVKLVSGLISEAIRRRASDIHLRPDENDVSILFRVDGMLLPVRRLAKPLLRAVVSRIKVIANMDVAEHRLPQDGRATVAEGEETVDLRISVLPTVDGESVVIRLLSTRQGLRSLDELGLAEHDEQQLRDLLARSHGMILVTGPTGSGKSTTLYAALLEERRHNVNIITVEDPVEYHVEGVEQVQVRAAIGYDFSRTLRNILRHDPDVIMIGEIRDHETAEIAVESALTGHIVLSTLHTNSAATTVTRMLDLGVESFLLRSTLLAVLAQRLARRNCPHCLVEEQVDSSIRESLGVDAGERFYRGAGCGRCDGTGVHGRLAVYELMPITHGMRPLITTNADGDSIHEQAVKDGMVPLTERALQLAREGVLSLAEVYRIRVE